MVNNNKINSSFVWLPNENQLLLLKAGLTNDQSAIVNWQKWNQKNNPNEVGQSEKRLFPLVYHNLQTNQHNDKFTDLLKRSHRESYKRVINLIKIAAKIINILNSFGIQSLVLKGIPLGVHYYPSIALRPMADIDLMVEIENVTKAFGVLHKEGWRSQMSNSSKIIEIVHSSQFLDAESNEMDLHWRLLSHCWNGNKTNFFWETAVPFEHHLIQGKTLCATDHLFHICCHGARFNEIPPIRWVADAIMVLRAGNEINWERICFLGEIYGQTLPLFYTLNYLKDKFQVNIPEDFLRELSKTPKTRLEEMSFRHLSEPPKRWTIWRFAKEAAFQYSSLTSTTNLKPRSLVFFKYLCHFLTKERLLKKILNSNN